MGLAPNEPFPSPNAAAINAIDYYMSMSVGSKREYGGYIYQMNNQWSYAKGVPGTANEIDTTTFTEPPNGSDTVGMWHIHQHDGYNKFRFSSDDETTANIKHIPIYLGVNDRRIKLYDPNTPDWLQERMVRESGPCKKANR